MSQFNSTQITITFTTDNDKFLLSLLFIFWLAQKTFFYYRQLLNNLVSDFSKAFNFTGKVFIIGFKSLVWGIL